MICPDCNKDLTVTVIKFQREPLPGEGSDLVRWRNIEADCSCGYKFFVEVDEKDFHEEHGE